MNEVWHDNSYIQRLWRRASEAMRSLSEQDLDRAVGEGVISARQRDMLVAMAAAGSHPAEAQSGRPAVTADEEPFELFQGFAEIFVALGIVILIGGVAGIVEFTIAEGLAPFFVLLLSAGLGHYYARHRRMTLPSIVSLIGVAASLGWFMVGVFGVMSPDEYDTTLPVMLASLSTMAVMVWIYRKYRLPFTMFLAGLSALMALMAAAVIIIGSGGTSFFNDGFFDLRENPVVAVGVLVFGLVALALALRFDMRDPQRIGVSSKSAFWLHILAGPAIVNTVTVTLFNIGGTTGHVLTALMLVLTTFLSLVIDRRSFLTAGLIYIGAVLSIFTDVFGDSGLYVNALIIGLLVTGLGTWWRGMRAVVMRGLPEFPGKHRLAPY